MNKRNHAAQNANIHPVYFKRLYHSPIGLLTLYATESALVEIDFEKSRYYGPAAQAGGKEEERLPILMEASRWLDRYFAGEKPESHELPLAPAGSAFRQEVWERLRQIPYGETTTYGAIAKCLPFPRMSAQAVGGAVGHNPISIIIPCHRVVGSNRSLTGFGGGIQTKIWLLTHEGLDMEQFIIPTKGTAL